MRREKGRGSLVVVMRWWRRWSLRWIMPDLDWDWRVWRSESGSGFGLKERGF